MRTEHTIKRELRRLRNRHDEVSHLEYGRRSYMEGRASGLLYALGSDVTAHAYLNHREEL